MPCWRQARLVQRPSHSGIMMWVAFGHEFWMVFVAHLILENENTMNWDNKINDPTRFRVLAAFNNEAVLDRETGLVWERNPSIQPMTWPNARLFCAQKAVGGRGGWRLPAFFELASLVDPSVQTAGVLRLPSGHPFMNVQA